MKMIISIIIFQISGICSHAQHVYNLAKGSKEVIIKCDSNVDVKRILFNEGFSTNLNNGFFNVNESVKKRGQLTQVFGVIDKTDSGTFIRLKGKIDMSIQNAAHAGAFNTGNSGKTFADIEARCSNVTIYRNSFFYLLELSEKFGKIKSFGPGEKTTCEFKMDKPH